MSDHEKAIIQRVLEKKNLIYDFEVHEQHVPRNGGLPMEECGDIDIPQGWEYTPPSWIHRNIKDKGTYYVLCKEKTGLRKIRAELNKNINLTIIWITIFISVVTSTLSNIIVKLFLHKFFGLGF